jgi:hypothetical protein
MFIEAKRGDVALRQEGNVYTGKDDRSGPPPGGQCL